MKDVLTQLVRQKRQAEARVTTENKDKLIRQMNKSASDYGFEKIKSNASVKDVQRFKSQYIERLTYDIVTLAIQQGRDITAEIESRDLKHSDDLETKRLGQFGKELAKAKKESDKNLTKEEKSFLDRGNGNVKGYGNENMMKLIEKARTPRQITELINEIKTQDPKQVFYNKQIELFEKVFQKVGIVREEDINKIKNKIQSLDLQGALDMSNYLLSSLETYGSPDNRLGKWDGDETELANARLDDVLINAGLKKTGSQKVKKVIEKYKSN